MRLLWLSNAPWVNTGYGMQTAAALDQLTRMGHAVAVHCIFGLQGSSICWNGCTMYPNNAGDWGIKESYEFYQDFEAQSLITLVDIWVMDKLDVRMNWAPWVPVDHNPIPPRVLDVARSAPGIIKPIAMSKFGHEEFARNGVDAYYIPHSVDTDLFKPKPGIRAAAREQSGWEDKFVIGMVGTNNAERKNWTEAMKAVAKFESLHPGEVIFYAHTEPMSSRGMNILSMREALNLENIMCFPPVNKMSLGIPEESLVTCYNAMDVFLLPSKGEGFGIPIMEAQACGTPVITTKCTAQEELVTDAGGWFIEDLIPTWESKQDSFQFSCHPDEIVQRLEEAYQAKKDGSIKAGQEAARNKALQYDTFKVYSELWAPTLADIEERLKQPRNLEGVQQPRLLMIPPTCIPRKVLDLGCGVTQPYKPYLGRLGEYVGVDIKSGEGILTADAHNLPFGDGEFGFVWCSELLEHVEDPARVVSEAMRVGRHGVIMFSTPSNPCFRMDPSHKVIGDEISYTLTCGGDGVVTW